MEQTLLASGYTPRSYNVATGLAATTPAHSSFSHLLLIHCGTQAFPSKAPVSHLSHYSRECLFISAFCEDVSPPRWLASHSSFLTTSSRAFPPWFWFWFNSLGHPLKAHDSWKEYLKSALFLNCMCVIHVCLWCFHASLEDIFILSQGSFVPFVQSWICKPGNNHYVFCFWVWIILSHPVSSSVREQDGSLAVIGGFTASMKGIGSHWKHVCSGCTGFISDCHHLSGLEVHAVLCLKLDADIFLFSMAVDDDTWKSFRVFF